MSDHRSTPREVLLIGFEPVEAARITLTLAQAGHRVHPAKDAQEAAAILDAVSVGLALADLEGPFDAVLGGIGAVRAGGRSRCPLLGVGSVEAASAMTDALRALGLEGFVPHGASPQELVLRVNRILFADRHASSVASRRVAVDLPATFDGVDGPTPGRILNVSETGLFLATQRPLPVNRSSTVRFALGPGAPPIAATCRVVWANTGGEARAYFPGMGLQFLELAPAARIELTAFHGRVVARLDAVADTLRLPGPRGADSDATGFGHGGAGVGTRGAPRAGAQAATAPAARPQ